MSKTLVFILLILPAIAYGNTAVNYDDPAMAKESTFSSSGTQDYSIPLQAHGANGLEDIAAATRGKKKKDTKVLKMIK